MDLRMSLVQLLLTVEPTLRSDVVTWGFVQLGNKNLQGWRPQGLSGQPVPLLGFCHGENITSHMQAEHLLSQFMPIVPLPIRHNFEDPVCLLDNLPAGTGWLLLGAPNAVPASGWSSHHPSTWDGQVVQLWLFWVPSAELALVYQSQQGPETGHSIVNVV